MGSRTRDAVEIIEGTHEGPDTGIDAALKGGK